MSTCTCCGNEFEGFSFGAKVSDDWCMPCWHEYQDLKVLSDRGVAERIMRSSTDLGELRRQAQKLEDDIEDLEQDRADKQEEVDALEERIKQAEWEWEALTLAEKKREKTAVSA